MSGPEEIERLNAWARKRTPGTQKAQRVPRGVRLEGEGTDRREARGQVSRPEGSLLNIPERGRDLGGEDWLRS